MNNFKLNVEDLNSSGFNLDLYLQQTNKTCNLNEILLFERDLFEEISVFQSDKQTLVYDNYNKFISATNTIGKIKYDFIKMEDEMKSLASNMESMTIFYDSITCTLQDSHSEISRILKIRAYLKNLQFLIKLPDKLKMQTQSKKYLEAAQDYLNVQKDLYHYCHLGSFQIIQQEINYILEEIKTNLWENLNCTHTKVKELSYSVNILLTLREPPKKLADKYIRNVEKQLTEKVVEWNKPPVINLFEYANLGVKLMEELCSFICEFDQMFDVINIPLKETKKSLDRMIKGLMTLFFESIQVKIDSLPKDKQIVNSPGIIFGDQSPRSS
uniref:Vacuolar protein sorting-associated protein 51 homolog n=1 Tax=Clastoptera arizonana TaxID=38151 RepID=A0A1B6CVQ9_9HEMI